MSKVKKGVDWIAKTVSAKEWQAAFASKEKLLKSNEAILKVGQTMESGGMFASIPRAVHNYRHGGEGVAGSLKSSLVKAHMNGEKVNYGAVAGSYVAASSAYRVASGGGIHKDKHGRSNIIGVPFI